MSRVLFMAALAVLSLFAMHVAQAADGMDMKNAGPNTQIVLQAYKAYGAGDIEALVALTTDDVDWGGYGYENEGAPYERYQGHDGVRKWFAGLAAESGPYTLTDLQFNEDGDTVLVTGELWATAKATGDQISGPFAHVFRFRGGKIYWFGNYSDSASYASTMSMTGWTPEEELNVATIKKGYGAFETGNMNDLFDCFADDIEWESVGPADKDPLFGPRHGKQAVMEWFQLLGSLVDPKPFTDVQFYPSGDTVVVTGMSSGTYRATGKSVNTPFVHIMKFRDGKLVWLREQLDSWAETNAYMN